MRGTSFLLHGMLYLLYLKACTRRDSIPRSDGTAANADTASMLCSSGIFRLSTKNTKLVFINFSLTIYFNTDTYCFYFLFDLSNTCAENAAHASNSQTKIGVRPDTDEVFCYKNTKNTFV
jgi:hypothetical protein